jgi:hypothetical protein
MNETGKSDLPLLQYAANKIKNVHSICYQGLKGGGGEASKKSITSTDKTYKPKVVLFAIMQLPAVT